MIPIAAVAGLLTAVCWGLTPVISKRGFTHGGNPMIAALTFITTGLVILWGSMAVLEGPARAAPSLSAFEYGIFLSSGLLGTALGRICNFSGIDRVGASVNSAIVSSNPLIATALAYLFLDELITLVQGVGVVAVVAGLVILSTSKGGDREGWTKRDLLFSFGAAGAFGLGAVIRRFGLTATPATPLEGAALNETAAFIGLTSFILANRGSILEPLPLKGYLYFVGGGILSTAGLLLLFVGLNNGPVAIVATLSGTASLFTAFFSYVLIGDLERITPRVVVGAAVVVIGTSIITVL